MKEKLTLLTISLFVSISHHFLLAQFPNPITLSTGQGTPGTQDPIWQCSPWSSTVPGNPMGETYGPTLINNNCAPGSWVDPGSLAPPMNNGNWITGTESNCAANTTAGYRYFRLMLNLPPDCNGNSVTVKGSYELSLIGYVDNYIHDVFINGTSQGINGGGFSTGSQLSIFLDGPWAVGPNYVDILVYNSPSSPPGGLNPYGLLLVADGTNSANMDSDGDGINDLDDMCPCDHGGTNPTGCPDSFSNTCDIDAIRSAFLAAGCIELPVCNNDCSMYFINPASNSGSGAQAFAQTLGANLISIQDAQENQCILDELIRLNQTGVIWIGFNDEVVEGQFEWYDQSPVTYTNWAPGEPNQSGNEDCVQIYPGGSYPGTWNDLSCTSSNAKSIIEVNLCPVVTASDIIVCTNETATIAASNPILGSNPYTFSWSNGVNTQTQVVPSVDSTYIVTVTDRYQCTVKDTAEVTTKPVPSATASPIDTLICSGESTAFQLSSNLTGTILDWIATPNNVNGSSNGTGSNITQTLNTTGTTNGSVTYSITPTLNGCIGTTVDATVTVSARPILTFSPATATICAGETLPVTVSGASTYDWSPSAGLNTTTGNSVDASPPNSQIYTVTGANADGCESTGTMNIDVNPLPQVQINPGSQSFCSGETTSFQLSSTPAGATFSWTANATGVSGSSNGTGNNITQVLTAAGSSGSVVYSVTATLNGCEGPAETATVTVNPHTALTDNILICNYDLPYSWNGQTITGGGTGVATHTAQDTNGCNIVTTLNLTVTAPPTIDFTVDSEPCPPAEVIILPTNIVPGGNCTWYLNGQIINGDCSGATVSVNDSGCHDVELLAADSNGCNSTVTHNNIFCIDVVPDALFELVQQSSLIIQSFNQSTNATSYLWELPNGTTTTEFAPTIIFETGSGEYIVTLYAYSQNGCPDSMTLTVEWPLEIPNVITANGDGVNDLFIIAGLVHNSKLMILNRWGTVVYTSDNYQNNWDGRDMRGNYVTGGVYTYLLELPDGMTKHGFVHVEGR